ncbi:MAG: CPBP family intramembrane metalloprotease [Bacteroidales bacterium]|nr:MAG: CPBP family intramembrane metalloprotease [Bacteroidales bacterium]
MFLLTKYAIPFMSSVTGQETVLFWFIIAGLGVFLPLIITGYFILKSEGCLLSKETLRDRLRFKKVTKSDLWWSFGGLLLVLLISGALMKLMVLLLGEFDHTPAFMAFEPLSTGRYWLLAVWLPYWILNILGEEFLWRGVMLPRQEVAFGKYTWVLHGFGWGIFHVAFGWQLLITLMPLMFIQSYIVQKTKNSWTGVIMHGGINGPSFIAISFGLI